MICDEAKIREVLSQMTLDEKLSLCCGDGKMSTLGVPRLGIAPAKMADGPQGVRIEDKQKSVALPCAISLACTFDRKAAREYGEVLGEETAGDNSQSILGPGVNLMRTPLGGRNFEYMGEDPVLAGEIAAAYISGCQSVGTGACIKHLALNNQERCRTIGSSNATMRTMRELYLRVFEIAVKKAAPWQVMSSYNRINGVYASEYALTQQQILKDEWGFDGVVVSDWGATHGAWMPFMSGLDIEMGGGKNGCMNQPLKQLAAAGLIPLDVLDEKVLRILRYLYRTGGFNPSARPKGKIDTPEHRRAAKFFAQKGSVLLKNDGVLPLDKKTVRKIAVIGPAANFQYYMGQVHASGGSGTVHPAYEITPLEGVKKQFPDAEIIYAMGENFWQEDVISPLRICTKNGQQGLEATYFNCAEDMDSPTATPLRRQVDSDFKMSWGHLNVGDVNDFAGDNTEVDPNAQFGTDLAEKCFAVRWMGFLVPSKSGKARIGAYTCGPCDLKIYLNGKLVVQATPHEFDHYTGIPATDSCYETDCLGRLGGYDFEVKSGEKIELMVEMRRQSPRQLDFRLLYQDDAEGRFNAAVDAAKKADVALFFGGANHQDDREFAGDSTCSGGDVSEYKLIGDQSRLLQAVAMANPRTAAVLFGGTPRSVEPWIDHVGALMMCWYAGMESGNAVAEMLDGTAYPGGRLCCTWGKELNDYACHQLNLVPGITDPRGARTDYLEGVFIGYRWFDKRDIAPRFAFGYGLSYTTFKRELVACEVSGRSVSAEVKITNIGNRVGKDVVQLYVRDVESSDERPLQELEDFAAVELAPGESKTAKLSLTERDFSYFPGNGNQAVFEPGEFELRFGSSSREIFAVKRVELK